jgi:3D (Asp-Asp-Asp) domain-containing protein
MALPDTFKVSHGTAIVWGQNGGTGVTADLSLNNLQDATAQQGASVDLGADWDQRYDVYLVVETGTAPTAGNVVDLYLVSSQNGTNWPAKVTGSDGAYTLGTADANLRQAGPPVVSLFATNDANTVLRQAPVVWRPAGRYVAPIVDNNIGFALRNASPATGSASRVIIIPQIEKVVE